METKNIIKITVIIKKITFIIFFLLIKYLKLKVLLALKWQFRWRPGATLEEGLMIKLNCHFKNILNFFFWIFLSCYSHFFKITSAVPLGLYLIPQDAFSFIFSASKQSCRGENHYQFIAGSSLLSNAQRICLNPSHFLSSSNPYYFYF